MPLALRFAIGSDVGRRRSGNQDSALAGKRLLVVADGMGGHAHGELASSLTVAAFAAMDEALPDDLRELDLTGALVEGIEDAANRLDAGARRDPGSRGMGTTVVALLFDDARIGILHIGDSRIYRLRDGRLTRITHDHTVVQALVDEGRITPEEAAMHPRRSVLLRALQAGNDPDPEVWDDTAVLGDRYLLCSDGATAVLDDELLHQLLSGGDRTPADVVDAVIALANEGGGPDNITCIVADAVEGDDDAAVEPVFAGAAAGASEAV
ncbi:protein phosphatase [Pseudonocardia sulfidoxydans NBRC 16205]|uniref:Protein phosphatase n=1 Tax=Pseudonocardia sulfidoxydans NBRC 16205 TaxID=1223511 RepID=A0A511DFR8_9PSEU|nr:protein phosphatase 2C domain-containing protein [Pseudonocardia sulfidoxydans]GEL23635.1 protein phosphatase [Pseudonocardia sulfidoxydans NBRC 16205]